jgi:hypothetical protein
VIAVRIDPDGKPAVVECPAGAFRYLADVFPEGFDGIRLAPDVIGYVGDCSLLDGSPANDAGQALADAVYRRYAGRAYHSAVCGPMVVVGVTVDGGSTSVPAAFIAQFLPQLERAAAAGGGR